MMNILKISFSGLNNLGNKTLEAHDMFEEGRSKYLEIIKSLNECWQGYDSEEFVRNASNYLNSLKNDSVYIENMGNFMCNSSKKYNRVVSDNTERMKRENDLMVESLGGSNENY